MICVLACACSRVCQKLAHPPPAQGQLHARDGSPSRTGRRPPTHTRIPPHAPPPPQDCAAELRKCLGESREWVEQLMDELEVAQGIIFSLRRELNQARR